MLSDYEKTFYSPPFPSTYGFQKKKKFVAQRKRKISATRSLIEAAARSSTKTYFISLIFHYIYSYFSAA